MNQESDSNARQPTDDNREEISNSDTKHRVARSRLVPTDHSLAFSESIASELGLPFDRDQTAQHSQELTTRYFNDIASVVPDYTSGISLEQGSINSLEAFVEPFQNQSWVFVDDHLDIWLFGLNILTLFKACYRTSKEEEEKLSDWVNQYLSISMTSDPHQSNIVLREETRKLFVNYAILLPVANALSVSMMTFIICHEIAHNYLGHLEQPVSPKLEMEADELAYDLFLRVAHQREQLTNAQIDESTTCAPALMMVYLKALNVKTLGEDIGTNQHPPASDRLTALIEMGKTNWSDSSMEKFTELKKQFEFLFSLTS